MWSGTLSTGVRRENGAAILCLLFRFFISVCVVGGGGKFLTTVTAVCVKLRKVGSGVGAVVKCFDS